jgi:hypothetical protein
MESARAVGEEFDSERHQFVSGHASGGREGLGLSQGDFGYKMGRHSYSGKGRE